MRAPLPASRRAAGRGYLFLALLFALALYRLYRSPWSASDLAIVPDSVEYAVGAQRLATLGRYDIVVDGVAHPPRYPPWFSALLAPVYALAPGELGNGILPVLALAAAAVAAAGAIGGRLTGAPAGSSAATWGGAAAAVALLYNPLFVRMSREVMSDVPALACGLIALQLYLGLAADPRHGATAPSSRHRAATYLAAGLAVAAATALRGEYVLLAAPFARLVQRESGMRWTAVSALFLPVVGVLAAGRLYDRATFGSIARTGYHYWTPVPYDYPRLLMSSSYLGPNLTSLLAPAALVALALGIAGSIALARRGGPGLRAALGFLLVGVLPASALHLVYFHPELRFHLPAIAILSIVGGAGLGALLPAVLAERRWAPLALVALLVAAAVLPPRPADPFPTRRVLAEALAAHTPRDAVIVTGLDPVYLEPYLLRGTGRVVVPAARSVEYASKLVARRRIPDPQPAPRSARDHRSPGLLAGGAREACRTVADESPATIAAWVREGRPVYLDGSSLRRDFPLARFLGSSLAVHAVPGADWLGRLESIPRPGGAG